MHTAGAERIVAAEMVQERGLVKSAVASFLKRRMVADSGRTGRQGVLGDWGRWLTLKDGG